MTASVSKTPRVSVCIPAYNSCEFITQTIESVLKQTLQDFELIICDDASSDGTRQMIRQFNDPRIRLVENPKNLGTEGNWNLVNSLATAPYIKLLCGDDVLYPDCLEQQVKVLDDPANASVVMVCSSRDIIDAAGRKVFSNRGITDRSGIMPAAQVVRRLVRSGTNPIGEPLTTMYRKSISDRVGRFDNSIPYCIDIDYWMRLLEHGSLYIIPHSLGAFRISPLAASTSLRRQQWIDMYHFYQRLHRTWRGELTRLDMTLGVSRSLILQYARRLVYVIYLRRMNGKANRRPAAE